MTQTDRVPSSQDCLFSTICGFLLPFFLAGAGGDPAIARAAIRDLIDAYNASTPTELDLVGRIISFSIVAMDNLRLSMTQGLSDTKVLKYRSNAVSLSRAAEQARKILSTLQDKQENTRKIPRPSIAAVPAPPPQPPLEPAIAPTPKSIGAGMIDGDIEAMKRDARTLIAAFSKHGAPGGSVIRMNPDPVTSVTSAVRAAMATVRRPAAG